MPNYKLNKADFELISLLDENAKQSLLSLSKRMHISPAAISKKMRLLRANDCFQFVTFIDLFSMGYNNAHVYMKLQGFKEEDYSRFISKVKNIRGIAWSAELFGDFDLGISFFYKKQKEFADFLEKLDVLGKNKIKEKETFFIKEHVLSSVSFADTRRKVSDSIRIVEQEYVPTQQEMSILNALKSNSRYSLHTLAEQLGLNPKTLKNQIRKLEKQKIIRWYKIIPNYEKLSKMYNICVLELIPGQETQELISVLQKERNIPFISRTFENSIIFDYISSSYQELKNYVNELNHQFDRKIADYKIFSINKVLKQTETYQ